MKSFLHTKPTQILVVGAASAIGIATLRALLIETEGKNYHISALVNRSDEIDQLSKQFPSVKIHSWDSYGSRQTALTFSKKIWKNILKGMKKVYWVDSVGLETEDDLFYDEAFYTQLPRGSELYRVSKKNLISSGRMPTNNCLLRGESVFF